MIHDTQSEKRDPRIEEINADLVVAGGGLAGTCTAIAAAREGIRVVLVQDRPMLGGNSSSEVRLWILGATSHLGNNNRWSREGGVTNEILEENLYRNRQGNPYILDTILLEKVFAEPNITLLLDTVVHDLEKSGPDTIAALRAFCPQNSTRYLLRAPYFCDASGDGIVAFMAGAAFRMGAEAKDEFCEGFAPDAGYGELLGHSMYFYSKDAGEPVKYLAPQWALKDITEIPRYRQFGTNLQGCQMWWLEYGGRLDTVHQSQEIKRELWRVIYGVWDHIKNSGDFPEAENLTLEWVAQIPGKRESRRFEGDYMLRQADVVERRVHEDTVAHGGWALDLHPADGVYSSMAGCTQWHAKGVYGIPWRCYYSRNISNLFLAGRIISASHVAFASTRVMATCGAGGQAVGVAAALCVEKGCRPSDLGAGGNLPGFQARLSARGQFLPGVAACDPDDLIGEAEVSASSELKLSELPPGPDTVALDDSPAMLIPLCAGKTYRFSFHVAATASGTVRVELWETSRAGEFTPEKCIESAELGYDPSSTRITAELGGATVSSGYHFLRICSAPGLRARLSEQRITGILSVSGRFNKAVATSATQEPPAEIGIDAFRFWLPQRRPGGKNLAMGFDPALDFFGASNVASGPARPTVMPGAWIASPDDPSPEISFGWERVITLSELLLCFDPDWDHPMESVLMTHPEEIVPFMVRDFDILDGAGKVLTEIRGHRGAQFTWRPDKPFSGDRLRVCIRATYGAPPAVFRVLARP